MDLQPDRFFLERLRHGDDLAPAIRDVFREKGIITGFFVAIGAVKRAKIAYYHQEAKEYRELGIDEPAEILSCIGNVSLLEGNPYVHAHLSLGLSDGTVKGGHLLAGTIIFACEIFGTGSRGDILERAFDPLTGLRIWTGKP